MLRLDGLVIPCLARLGDNSKIMEDKASSTVKLNYLLQIDHRSSYLRLHLSLSFDDNNRGSNTAFGLRAAQPSPEPVSLSPPVS